MKNRCSSAERITDGPRFRGAEHYYSSEVRRRCPTTDSGADRAGPRIAVYGADNGA